MVKVVSSLLSILPILQRLLEDITVTGSARRVIQRLMRHIMTMSYLKYSQVCETSTYTSWPILKRVYFALPSIGFLRSRQQEDCPYWRQPLDSSENMPPCQVITYVISLRPFRIMSGNLLSALLLSAQAIRCLWISILPTSLCQIRLSRHPQAALRTSSRRRLICSRIRRT